MKIALNEVYNLNEVMDNSPESYDCFVSDLEETDDYMEILDNIMCDLKHIIASKLREAIDCGFDTEILSIDYGMDSELIELLQEYGSHEVEVKF